MTDFIIKSADTLERGDVFYYPQYPQKVVLLEPSDHVVTAPEDEMFNDAPAKRCCEPRIGYLGRKRGLLTHRVTYVIWPNNKKVKVREFLDVDIRSARPEPHPDLKRSA